MALIITSLNSGSNGNCYYAGNGEEAVLIDAGLSCRETEKRMKRLGLSMEKVKAIFVSHEHTDHIKGLAVIAAKYQLPVYITAATLRGSGCVLQTHLVNSFTAQQPVVIGNISVIAFPKFHDAADPYSFMISCNGVNVGVFTDIGTPCKQLTYYFKQCHAAFLEANYDEDMLSNGSYPYHLKRRITSGKGHLSNSQALATFVQHRPSFMSHLFLAHLSHNNNCPQIVKTLFNAHANGVKIIIASRYEETATFCIEAGAAKKVVTALKTKAVSQLSFSFS